MAKDTDRLTLYKELEKQLKYSRFVHTMGVTFTATSLAMRYGADVKKAELAGLLHDCAKYVPVDEMERICREGGLEISSFERGNSALLHSKAGSVLARTKYGVTDKEVLDAIRFHTTGRPGMTLLDKIVFIADYMEPGREEAPDLSIVRPLAFSDLDQALLQILSDTLDYLEGTGKKIDPMTRRTWEFYKTMVQTEK
ncbi:MAG: bis(5'-nucleosyl)-tetraphosphatase (symmetrical) YqeK [Lachnospiraceae bacterium]|jgi:predicted HD superfamily hydrolase involved in NAD metabolism|nr:bis(5'-nucleosyl)-tetraphosphatase (symmetrical) YqeK [Lachnospiraceae bacterium]MCI1397716.1 bis(5'-nucleosyl)-tetraphosphatase (symmetrical) YqeK [Lachnospiraceae bacterium]MCI1423826.1 bis(5'-nucleosyl)-tetraphosphatase (symmetrical) YqeK [Lachnospiraceae bacterium]MCI1452634.1 bis(5'-nucleosyl)-tetraphosphatase (symmetrical) YqeK [Lachnospiraceae bacterium]